MSIFYKLSVKEITRETPKAVSVAFDIPENLKSEFQFIPGQYITIEKELDGIKMRRAYSICSSVKSGELRIAIKEVEKGVFSVYANRKLKAGDVLEVAAPEGRFILPVSTDNKKNYLAFAAGSGITPVLSMITSVLESEPESKFVLVYGNKSSDEAIFKTQIDALQAANSNRFEVFYVYSQKLSDKALFGRIDETICNEIIKNKCKLTRFDNYFLCGPEKMIDSVRNNLLKHGVSEDNIHFELFTATSAKKEIKSDLDGNTKITIVLDEEDSEFDMRQDELILDVALKHGLDAPYSCQGGVCSSCLARVTEGKAVMEKNTILTAEEVEEGLILTCQAHPVTPTIKIDYDDV
jgi:ring-1,2-phenylacetyl-CoA epoxidase subunit PaaE